MNDNLALIEAAITDEQELPVVTAPTCQRANVATRLTSPPATGTGKRVAFVYVTPTTSDTAWSDAYVDLPMICQDGTAYSSIDYMYRNMSRFMARELARDASLGPRRLATFIQSYTTLCVTCPQVALYAGYNLKTSNTYAYLNNLSPERKLEVVRTKLIAAGFNDPNTIYLAILHARQEDISSTTTDERRFVGWGYKDGYGTTQSDGYTLGYAMSLRIGWYSGTYYTLRYGCTTSGDAVALHEVSHVLGAVPTSAAGDDGMGHMVADYELMAAKPRGAFINYTSVTGTTVPHVYLDYGADDYRTYTYGRGFTSSATSYQTDPYRVC